MVGCYPAYSRGTRALITKKIQAKATYLLLLVFIFLIISVFVCNGCGEPNIEKSLGINFENKSYLVEVEEFREPGSIHDNYVQAMTSEYRPFHPSVMTIFEYQCDEGSESYYRKLLDVLANCDDEVELLEIYSALLTGQIYDPEKAISVFRDQRDASWSDEKCALADYLLALTYTQGDFDGAILSDEEYRLLRNPESSMDWEHTEELMKKATEKEEAVVEAGARMLQEVYNDNPDSRIGVLARFSHMYLGQKNPGGIDLEMAEETLNLVQEKYPDTALTTLAYIFMARAYLLIEDTIKAKEYFYDGLDFPNFQMSNDRTAREDIIITVRYIETGMPFGPYYEE
jgi:hypothetical protein